MKTPFLLLAILLAACIASQREEPVSEEEFKLLLLSEGNFTIFMNATGLGKEAVPVYQCGADLSGSLGLLGKNVTPYVIDDGACITLAGNTSLDECLRSAATTYSFFIGAGSSPPAYFKRRALVFVPANYSGGCRIAARYGVSGG